MRKGQYRLTISLALLVAANLSNLPAACGQTVTTQQRGVEDISPPTVTTVQLDPYYALVIGNNNYQYVNKLQTAVNDAKAVAQVLNHRYGFTTTVLTDATRSQILTAFIEYRRTLPESSNLLIYYAGHGHHDLDTNEAYWLPVDAQQDNNENWISANDITSDIRAIPSRHILIISDSCYSGALAQDTRAADVAINPQERGAYLAKLLKAKSRNLMASGGDEPVTDSGGGGHSIFASTVLDGLNEMDDHEFTAADLFQRFIQPGVAGRSAQVPQYSVIINSGHLFGDFVFPKPGTKSISSSDGLPPVVVTTRTVDPQAQAINDALHSYKDAYESESLDEVQRIWPSLNKAQKNELKQLFSKASAVRLRLDCSDPAVAGDVARVKCQQEWKYTFNGKVEPAKRDAVEITLKRSAGGWLVDGVQAQAN